MEYHKVYCNEHPYEPVTNFCTDCIPSIYPAQCLVGLCATCICEHTRSHVQRGSSPSYENIKNTYTRYNDRMREQVELIEQDKVWLVLTRLSRTIFATTSKKKGRSSRAPSPRPEKIVWPWSTSTLTNSRPKSVPK